MAGLFSRTGDDSRVIWGHSYKCTAQHFSADDLHHLLFTYDKLASDALDRLDEISPPKSKSWKCPHGSGAGERDPYELLMEHSSRDETLAQLWAQVTTIPEWVDWDQIHRGQRVFYTYSSQVMFGLLYTSLLGGMGSSRVVETLGKTGGFGVRVARRRLLETLQHFMDVTDDLDAVKPGGKGFVSSIRVRLLHAAVRRRIMQLASDKPGYFDMNELGVPINDLHCIATITAYSSAIVYLALPRQGVVLTPQQAADYLAFWRWIGYLLGTPVDWMATPEQAKAMMESVMVSELQPSRNSQILANNILTAESNVPPLWASREYLAAITYRLNEYDLSHALGIDRPPVRFRVLVWFQCIVFMCFSYMYPLLSNSRQQSIEKNFKRVMHQMIARHRTGMGGGGHDEIKFEFQYIPALGKSTDLGHYENMNSKSNRAWKRYMATMIIVGLLLGAMVILQVTTLPNLPLHVATALMPKSQSLGRLT